MLMAGQASWFRTGQRESSWIEQSYTRSAQLPSYRLFSKIEHKTHAIASKPLELTISICTKKIVC